VRLKEQEAMTVATDKTTDEIINARLAEHARYFLPTIMTVCQLVPPQDREQEILAKLPDQLPDDSIMSDDYMAELAHGIAELWTAALPPGTE
jgi:hypothetical protein